MELKWINSGRVLEEYANQVHLLYMRKLEEEGFRETTLYKSVKASVEVGGKLFEVAIQLEDYWKYIENGIEPGKGPSPEAIEKWIIANPVMPWNDGRNPIPSEASLARLIGNEIRNNGLKPRPIFSEANEDVFANLQTDLLEALKTDLAGFVVDTVNLYII